MMTTKTKLASYRYDGRRPNLTNRQKRQAIRRRDQETLAEIGRSYNVSGWFEARTMTDGGIAFNAGHSWQRSAAQIVRRDEIVLRRGVPCK
jgi:hypothetical protein